MDDNCCSKECCDGKDCTPCPGCSCCCCCCKQYNEDTKKCDCTSKCEGK